MLELIRSLFRRRAAPEDDIARWVKAVAETSVFGAGPNGVSSDTAQMGHARTQETYFRDWVYAAVRPIAQRIAAQPVRVARRATSPKRRLPKHLAPRWLKDMREGVELMDTHPIIDALDNPNKAMVRWSLLFDTVVSLELTGRAFWWLDEQDGFEIFPIPASWIEPRHDRGLFSSYVIRPRGTIQSFEVPAENIVRFTYPNPADPVLGSLSPLQAAARGVMTDDAIATAQHQSFVNGIFPTMAIVVGRNPDVAGTPGQRPMLTKEQRQQVIDAILRAHRGVIQYGHPVILDALIQDIKKLTNTPAEMDFMQSSKMTKDRIFQIFGTNPIIAGQVESANKASSIAAEENFLSGTVNPKIELISQWLSKFLPARFGDPDVFCWLDTCRPHDPEQTRAEAQQLGNFGAITRDELRALYNYPPLETLGIDGGDELVSKPAPVMPGGDEVRGLRNRRHVTVRTKDRSGLVKVWLKRHGESEAEFRTAMLGFFREQSKAIIAELKKVGPAAGVDAFFRPTEWDAELKTTAEKQIETLATRGAKQELKWFGPKAAAALSVKDESDDFGELPPKVIASLQSFVHRTMKQPWWDDINSGIHADIEKALKVGLGEGESNAEMISTVEDLLGEGNETRAERIVRSETTGALNSGHSVARSELAALGLIKGKVWNSLPDDATREDHADADGQEVGVDDPFIIGGEECEFPGDISLSPANRVNCRCVSLSVPVSDEEL